MPLIKLQKRAVRATSKDRSRDHTSPLFKSLKLLKLSDINSLQIAMFMFRYHHKLLPALFNDYFLFNADVHSHYTRASDALHLPAVRTNLRKKSIVYIGPHIWNQINVFIRNKSSVISFKFHYKKFLISHY